MTLFQGFVYHSLTRGIVIVADTEHVSVIQIQARHSGGARFSLPRPDNGAELGIYVYQGGLCVSGLQECGLVSRRIPERSRGLSGCEPLVGSAPGYNLLEPRMPDIRRGVPKRLAEDPKKKIFLENQRLLLERLEGGKEVRLTPIRGCRNHSHCRSAPVEQDGP
jgi:hypothetical protein